jgi:hypothetical protein
MGEIMDQLFTTQCFAIDSSEHGNNQVRAGGALLDKIRDWLKSISGALPQKEEFLKIVGQAYDQYVAPLDLPGVPNLVEPWVDSALKAIVLQQASRLYDRIATE